MMKLDDDEFRYVLEKDSERIALAEKAGFEIVRGDDRTLLLDLDTPNAISQFASMRDMVRDKVGFVEVERWPSKSGGGRTHVRISIRDPLSPIERIAVQAMLGSDPKRELLGLLKIRAGINGDPSVLFRPRGL